MQIQELKGQKQLLQQLVQTLERQIQSKNQQQNIMIQQFQHLIKENDSLNTKCSLLQAENRKLVQKEKYYQQVVKDTEEVLTKTRGQLQQTKNKLQVISLSSSGHPNNNLGRFQKMNPSISNKIPQPMRLPSQVYSYVPKMHTSQNSLSENNTSSFESISVGSSQQIHQQIPASSSHVHSLQQQIKSLKSGFESLKLQMTHKELQLKSKNQKIDQSSQQLHSSSQQIRVMNVQMQDLNGLIDDLRREKSQLIKDLELREEETHLKDEKFFQMYRENDDDWKLKYQELVEHRNILQSTLEDHISEIETKNNQINSLKDALNILNTQLQTKTQQIQALNHDIQNLTTLRHSQNLQITNINEQLQRVKSQNQQLSTLNNQLKTQLQDLQSLNQYLQQNIVQKNHENQQLTQRLTQKLNQNQEQAQRINEIQEQFKAQLTTVEDHTNENIQRENQQLHQMLKEMQANQQQLVNCIADLEIQLNLKNQLIADLQIQIQQQQIQLHSNQASNLNTISENQQNPSQHEQQQTLIFQQNDWSKSERQCKNSNHVDLQMFQILQSEYARLHDEHEDDKKQAHSQIQSLQNQLHLKDYQIRNLNQNLEDLTRLFAKKAQQNQNLRESIDKDNKINYSPKTNSYINQKKTSRNENLVEKKLFSAKSQEDIFSDTKQQKQLNYNGGFGIKIFPSQRKSDLPLLTNEFAQEVSEDKKSKSKSKINFVEENIDLEQHPVDFGMNYFRNSFAGLGFDIDFKAIAKHIGLEIQNDSNPHSSRKDFDDDEKPRVQFGIESPSSERVTQQKQEEDKAKKEEDGPTKVGKIREVKSSYGSNLSQKRSNPEGLVIPKAEEQLNRSSFGSNNQFTQIVIYYQEEMGRLKQQVKELTEETERLRSQKDEEIEKMQRYVQQLQGFLRQQVESLEKSQRQNQYNLDKIQQTEAIISELRIELDRKSRSQHIGLDVTENSHQTQLQVSKSNKSQVNEFRTSVEGQISGSKQKHHINMSPQEQYETVELIGQLTSQLQSLQQRLVQAQHQSSFYKSQSNQLNTEKTKLSQQLQLLKKDYESLVNQFSQLSLQQNDEIVILQQKIQQSAGETNKFKEENQQLLKINKQLFDEQSQEIQEKMHKLHIQYSDKLQKYVEMELQKQRKEFQQVFERKETERKIQSQQKAQEFEHYLKEKQSLIEKINIQNIQKDSQLQNLNHQLSTLYQKLQQNLHFHQESTEQKENVIRKMEKSLKEAKEQAIRLRNQNQTLTKEFDRSIKAAKENQNLAKRYNTLQIQNKSLQQTITKLSINQQIVQSGNDSHPMFFSKGRISDMIDSLSPQSQQNFTINNISNIQVAVDQLGDDSFLGHEREKEVPSQKDFIDQLKKEVQRLNNDAKDRQAYVCQIEEKLDTVDNSYNSEIMGLKKVNAELNSELLKLKKLLFTYQRDNGDIQKFIQQNFLQEKTILPKRFSVQSDNRQFQSNYLTGRKFNNSQKNNSFQYENYNRNDLSLISGRKQMKMSQLYNPRQGLASASLNMGQMFMGRKTRQKSHHNTQNFSFLAQIFRNNDQKQRSKNYYTPIQSLASSPKNNSKYLREYERYEQKIKRQKKNEPSYGDKAEIWENSKKTSIYQS